MKNALKFISQKDLGFLVLEITKKLPLELLLMDKLDVRGKGNLQQLKVKDVMTKLISTNADILAAKALSLMNSNRITFYACIEKQKNKTIGVIHIHNILENNIQ